MAQSVLVTGGAGYIGSHIVLALLDAGHGVVVLDDLSSGRRELVPANAGFIEADVGDRAALDACFDRHDVGAVIHAAGSIIVSESVEQPLRYYDNNTAKSRVLIDACVRAGVDRFIFSSTAAVYGEPAALPIPETAPLQPINPYGRSKLAVEWMLRDAGAAYGLRSGILRYFNAAGADPAGRSGQSTPFATHLIKVASQLVTGARDHMTIFGDDYPTEDGTCVRDYIHVSDLAAAHLAALADLEAGGDSFALNCGYGRGHSVREVLDAVTAAAGRPLDIRTGSRRAGDPPALVADVSALGPRLRWQPRHDDLTDIVGSALAWETHLAGGGPAG